MSNDFNFSDNLPGNPIKQWIFATIDEEKEKWNFINSDSDFRKEATEEYGLTFVPIGLFVGVCFNGVFNADYSICSYEENFNFDKNMAERIAYGRATEGMTRKKRAKSRVLPELMPSYYNFIERCERYYKGAKPSDRVLNSKQSCENSVAVKFQKIDKFLADNKSFK